MSTRSYRGNRGKNVYEIANFSKGVNATNAAMPPGYLKELVNMNISPDGLSLRPREPYLNYALYLKDRDEFISFSNRVGMFVSKQFPNWEFIIDFFGKRYGYEKEIEDYRIIDGDTFIDNRTETRYRLLIVDAYELGTEEGQQAKEFVENLTDGKPIIVRYDSQAPSWVDKYNRHLVWAETKGGLNIQRALIAGGHAKYLDLRVTEHENDILKTEFEGEPDYEGNTMIIEDYPGGIPVVYRRNINQPPELIDGRPSYMLYEFNNIFMGDMLNDLEIGYSYVPNIKINKINSEFGRYRTEYNPLEQNKMSNHDGIVSLVNVIGDLIIVVTLQNEINIESELTLAEVSNFTLEGEIYYNTEVGSQPSQNIDIEEAIEAFGDLELGTSSHIELLGNVNFEIDYQYQPSQNIEATIEVLSDLELQSTSYVLEGNLLYSVYLNTWTPQTINSTIDVSSELELELNNNFELLSNVEFIGSIVEPPPQPTLTWQYNGPSSSQNCLPAGYNPIGDSCTTSGQTILVSGDDIGRTPGCYELICKI